MAGNRLILSSVLSTTVPLFVERTGADSALEQKRTVPVKEYRIEYIPHITKLR